MTTVVDRDTLSLPDNTGAWLLSDRAEVAAKLDRIVISHQDDTPQARRIALLTTVARAVVRDALIDALAAVLDDTLTGLLVASYARYQSLLAAGRETSGSPSAESTVTMMGHTVRVQQQPDLELRVDGIRVLRLHVQLDIRFLVVEATARVRGGRLVEVRAGNPDVEAMLSISGVAIAHKTGRLARAAVLDLGAGMSLV